MRSFIYVALSALAALAAAEDNAFNVPSGGYDIAAGVPTTLNWDPTTSGTVTLKLQIGRDITPDSGIIIAENIPNSGSYSFVPPTNVEAGTEYTVEIIDDNNPDNYNFTPTFTIDNASGDVTTTAEATTTTEAATTTSEEAPTTATTESAPESTTTMASSSSSESSGTTMVTTSSATGTSSATVTDSESSGTGTATTGAPAATTTAPGAGASLKVQGSMFALVAAVMAAL